MLAFGVHPVNFLLDNYAKVCTRRARTRARERERAVQPLRRRSRAGARAEPHTAPITRQYGEVFTILLFGRKMTYLMTPEAADSFFNAKHEDVSAEKAYAPITVPVFGKDVVYDVPYSVLVEQKKCAARRAGHRPCGAGGLSHGGPGWAPSAAHPARRSPFANAG